MENEFQDEMKSLKNDELKDIAVNFTQYRGLYVAAAKQELISRGIELSDTEKKIIEETKNKRKQEAISNNEQNKSNNSFLFNWKLNIVKDESAPKLYSRQVIYIFTILFSVLFGGILLAINFNISKKNKGIFPVIIFSAAYTIAMIIGLNYVENKTSSMTFILNAVGALILDSIFWKKYIGVEYQYRTKPFWIPLTIGISITIFFIAISIIAISL